MFAAANVLWMYVFNIYEIKTDVEKQLISSSEILLTVSIIPLNSFGTKVPFRIIKGDFSILEGENEIIDFCNMHQKDQIVFKVKRDFRKIVLGLRTNFSVNTTRVIIDG